eukprot:TRINITY_DN6036_c0_g1_i1.p1 TRINITY_DN6036_c0_g1~~TRINITY_DN6036_c0_g1_i1.p1  ORF type:complete len:137 (+),score=31.01 TRINITY_DN6036_c0_g1_i1:23-412(+)
MAFKSFSLLLLAVFMLSMIAAANADAKAAGKAKLKKQGTKGVDPFSEKFFRLHDFDNNENLDQEEVAAVYDSTADQFGLPRGPESEDMLKMVWQHVDTNQDQQISLEEFKKATAGPPPGVNVPEDRQEL